MDITWLAHSCFRIRSANATILTDPFPSSLGGSVGAVEENPGIVTLSSRHPNHSDVSGPTPCHRCVIPLISSKWRAYACVILATSPGLSPTSTWTS